VFGYLGPDWRYRDFHKAGGPISRARGVHKLAIHPAQLREQLGEQAYAALTEEERNGWWLRLPEFPDAPPEEWTS
jgi:hypothetical protein